MTQKKMSPVLLWTAFFAYASMALLGAVITIVNSTQTHLAESYGVAENRISLLISCLGLGRLVIQVACGVLSDRIGRKTLVLIGFIGLLLFFCLMPAVTSLAGGMLMCVVCGIFYGMINTTMLALIFDCYAGTGRTEIAQVRVQTIYAIGGILVPMGASALLASGLPWKYLYWFLGFITVLLILSHRRISFPPMAARTVRDNGYTGVPSLKREGFLLILATFCLYGAHTMGLSWLTSLAAYNTAMDRAGAVLTLSVFSFGALLGSLAVMALLRRVSNLRVLTGAPLMACVFFGMCVCTKNPWLFRVCALLAGMCTGSLFNLIVGVAGQMFPQISGTISGMVATASALAYLAVPALTGWMLDSVRTPVMFCTVFLLLAVGVVTILALRRRDRLLRG